MFQGSNGGLLFFNYENIKTIVLLGNKLSRSRIDLIAVRMILSTCLVVVLMAKFIMLC